MLIGRPIIAFYAAVTNKTSDDMVFILWSQFCDYYRFHGVQLWFRLWLQGFKIGPDFSFLISKKESLKNSKSDRRTISNPDWLPHTATGGERPGSTFVWKYLRYYPGPSADSAGNIIPQYSNWCFNYSCQGFNWKRKIFTSIRRTFYAQKPLQLILK